MKESREKMESKKRVGSSSFIHLFGSEEQSSNNSSSTATSTGVFATMFQPPSKMPGRYSSSSNSREAWEKHSSKNQEWKAEKETSEAKSENGVKTSRKERSTTPTYRQDGKVEPCHLSSSLYYGGQDDYSHSSSPQSQNYGSSAYPSYNNDGNEGDFMGGKHSSQSASRGNWWEGSLYY